MNPKATQASTAPPATDTSFFVTGGTVPTDAPSYIERGADRELLACLLEGRLCYVLTSRQMGKSSLMARTALKLQERGVNTITLDFSAIGQNLSPSQWYAGLIARVGQQLRLEDELDAFWNHRREFGPCQRFFAVLTDVALPALADRHLVTPTGSPRLVIFVDELDTVRSLPFKSDEFFAAVRELYNRRTSDAALRGITFCLLGVATPSDLIHDQKITPFNVGTRIELHDFTPREAVPLARGLSGPLSTPGQPQQVLERVLHWTGGHPYLTQRLCRMVSGAGLLGRAGQADVDRLCAQLFLSDEARERDDNLAFVRERILRNESDRVAALVRYREILRRPGRVRLDELDPSLAQLRLAGIVRAERGRMRVRNRIYEQVFNGAWVRNNLPDAEVTRQRRAFWRGVMRAAGVALPTLAVITGLAFWALSEKRESQRGWVDSNVGSGVLRMEQGDHLAALPYFVAALQLADEASAQHSLARTRIGAVLAASPQLRFLLPHRGRVEALAYSADSRRLFTVTALDEPVTTEAPPGQPVSYAMGEAVIWDTETGGRIATVTAAQPLERLRVAADGRHFATLSRGHELAFYRAGASNEVHLVWATNEVRDAGFVPGTADLVVGQAGQLLRQPAAGGRPEPLFGWEPEPELFVQSFGFDAAGRLLAVALGGRLTLDGEPKEATRRVLVLELGTGRKRELPAGQFDEWRSPPNAPVQISHLEFSPQGRWLAACGDGMDDAAVWDLETEAPKARLKRLRHENWVRSASFARDGERLVTSCGDGRLYIWDVAQWAPMPVPVRHRHDIYRAVLNPGGELVASVSADGTAMVWDLSPANRIFAPMYHGHFVKDVQFSPDGRQLATASLDHTVRVWTPPGLEPEWLDPQWSAAGSGRLEQVQASRHGACVATVAVNPQQHTLQVWTTLPAGVRTLLITHEPVTALAVDDAGTTVAAALGDRVLCWNAADGTERADWHEARTVSELRFDPAGGRLALGFADGGIGMHDLSSGTNFWSARLHSGANEVRRAAFSPDGQWVAFGHGGLGALSVHEAARGRIIMTNLLGRSENEINALGFNPRAGGRQLAAGLRNSGYESLAAWIFDFGPRGGLTGERQLGHWDGVKALAYRDDGARLATASEDGSVVVWNPDTGARRIAPVRLGRYHASRVAFSPGAGDLLFVVWTHGGRARVVIADSGQPLMPALDQPAELVDGGFLADGRTLFLADEVRGLGIFRLPEETRTLAELQALALLLYPGNVMALDDARLQTIRDQIHRGDAEGTLWQRLWTQAALREPAPEPARIWR